MIYVDIKTKERNKDRKKREKDTELVFFEPSQRSILKKLKEPLNWLIKAINSFNTLEPDIVSLVKLERKVAFEVDKEMPMFAKAFEYLDYLVGKGLERPNEILEKFQKYSFLLHKPAEDVVKSYWGKDKENKKSVNDLDEYLAKVSESINEIQGLCINEMNTHFFQVRTKNVKETLIKRAKGIMKALTAKIKSSSKKTVKEIQQKYDDLKTKMTTEPETEEELVEMQQTIENYEHRLDELDKEVDQTERYLDLLTKYGASYPRNDVVFFWLLKVMPMECKKASSQGNKMAQKQETMFLNKLEEEKAQFQLELKSLESKFEWIRVMKDYELWKGKDKENFELNQQIGIALKKRANFNKRETLFNIENTPYENLNELEEKNEPYKQMRQVSIDFISEKSRWTENPLVKIKFKQVMGLIDGWLKKINTLKRRFESKEDADEALEICRHIKLEIDEFKKVTPLIRELTREAVVRNPNYWKEILKTIGALSIPQATTTLKAITGPDNLFMNNLPKIEEICVRADKEFQLRSRFHDGIMKALNECELELLDYKSSGTQILGDTLPLQQLFDDQFNAIVMMKQNPFIKPIRLEVEQAEKKLIAF
jgi:dynein heavy chain